MKSFFIFVLACLLCISCSQNPQDENHSLTWIDWDGKLVAWDYPVMPGTKEWEKLTTHQQMLDACQIPAEVLSYLSTEDLTRICLRYPLLGDIFAFNTLDDGLDQLFDHFNGIRELFKEDPSIELLKQYSSMIENLSSIDGHDKALFLIRYVYPIEALLSRLAPQNDGRNERLKQVLNGLITGYEAQIDCPEEELFVDYNFFSRAHVILKICEQCRERLSENSWEGLLAQGWIFDSKTIDVLNEMSYQLIN